MLGYKDGQGIQPSYNYYLETDLDNVDDQLVDYSKRYADQDSDDVCCSTSGKKRHHSPSIANSVTKQSYDEVKVYCMEGTPLMISSASSLCDLREVDITEQGPECEKEESRKEDEENTAQEVKANLTKSSSPLMFSRTSSIGSLSSFEQHSIVDDRSSVSAFRYSIVLKFFLYF
ncbi:uncharacterized protein TNCT_222261 [Trichonephila clavata]|uniref:Uncharacterized protein n=1 Tax=Trichonephila clavata TaxID=2740835 RepID=A0A8X6GS96_TRICU|nr:uncharacterized protein TNCT_222261 [Trichonephila clavata]